MNQLQRPPIPPPSTGTTATARWHKGLRSITSETCSDTQPQHAMRKCGVPDAQVQQKHKCNSETPWAATVFRGCSSVAVENPDSGICLREPTLDGRQP